jgi:hypothetical protein
VAACIVQSGRKENVMYLAKPLAGTALGLLICVSADAQPAVQSPPRVCLYLRDIHHTDTPDDRTIVFHMHDGKVWQNTLRSVCPMLRTSPYSQVVHTDQVCSNQQFIRVAQSGYTCVLGDFTPLVPKP